MPKGIPKESDINKKPTKNYKRQYLFIEISEKEKTYYERLASVLSKIEINDKKHKVNSFDTALVKQLKIISYYA